MELTEVGTLEGWIISQLGNATTFLPHTEAQTGATRSWSLEA